MNRYVSRRLGGAAAIVAITVIAATAVRGDDDNQKSEANRYKVNKLVSDIMGDAPNLDTNLKNAWGVAFSPAGSPFWVADNATGRSTLYAGDGTLQPTPQPLVVKIPGTGGPGTGAPTGIIWNPSGAFLVPTTNIQAAFIFDTEDGTISAWARGLSPPDEAVLAPTATDGAVYKGLAFGVNEQGAFLFATDFHGGKIDVFGSDYKLVPIPHGKFVDPKIPAGFAPFGIQNIDGNLIVTYAKQDKDQHDDVAGPGNGFVDAFDTDGNLLRRLATRGLLNSPWGVARASFAFGRFSGDLLIGNFGDGRINAVTDDANDKHSLEQLKDARGKTIVIDGLWTLTLGGGAKSNPSTLYFTAGPNGETDGLFGTITPVSGKGDDD
jgi:uncharacterized protein (TIGR03118 family)